MSESVFWPLELHRSLLLLRTEEHLICCPACACHNKKITQVQCSTRLRPSNKCTTTKADQTHFVSLDGPRGLPTVCFSVFQGFSIGYPAVFRQFSGFRDRGQGKPEPSAVKMPMTMPTVCECSKWLACLPVGQSVGRSEVQVSHCRTRELNLLININKCINTAAVPSATGRNFKFNAEKKCHKGYLNQLYDKTRLYLPVV